MIPNDGVTAPVLVTIVRPAASAASGLDPNHNDDLFQLDHYE
jgi:hypothetical protein